MAASKEEIEEILDRASGLKVSTWPIDGTSYRFVMVTGTIHESLVREDRR